MSGVWQDGKFVLQSTLEERERILRRGIQAVLELIGESYGVAGLHLNGDVAGWHDLRSGGRFEEWLIDFDKAVEISKGGDA